MTLLVNHYASKSITIAATLKTLPSVYIKPKIKGKCEHVWPQARVRAQTRFGPKLFSYLSLELGT